MNLNDEEYDEAVRDLVNFLEYSGEPMKLERQNLGLLGDGLYRYILCTNATIEERVLA